MLKRIALALLAWGGLSDSASAGVKVLADLEGDGVAPYFECADADAIAITPGTDPGDIGFSFRCAADGIRRGCRIQYDPGNVTNAASMVFVYRPTGDGTSSQPSIGVGCVAGTTTVTGTEVYGFIDENTIASADGQSACNPATQIELIPSLPVQECVRGVDPDVLSSASCVKFQCPGDDVPRGCFPVIDLLYEGVGSDAPKVRVVCETRVPMLVDGFD